MKWVIYYPGPLTASGYDEAVAAFATRKDAEEYRRAKLLLDTKTKRLELGSI